MFNFDSFIKIRSTRKIVKCRIFSRSIINLYFEDEWMCWLYIDFYRKTRCWIGNDEFMFRCLIELPFLTSIHSMFKHIQIFIGLFIQIDIVVRCEDGESFKIRVISCHSLCLYSFFTYFSLKHYYKIRALNTTINSTNEWTSISVKNRLQWHLFFVYICFRRQTNE